VDNHSCKVTYYNNTQYSILNRTGMFKGEGNSKENPANYVVKDFREAVRLIFKLEEIS